MSLKFRLIQYTILETRLCGQLTAILIVKLYTRGAQTRELLSILALKASTAYVVDEPDTPYVRDMDSS